MLTLKHSPTHRLFLLVGILAAALLSLRWLPVTPIIAYTTIFIFSSFVFWLVCRQSLRIEELPKVFPILVVFFFVRLSFIGMDPLGSDDVYRYVWDGKVQAAGINPYRYAPNDEALSNLRTEQLPALVNHPEMKTIYFPLCQWIFYLGYSLSGEQVWGFQLLILLAEALTVIGLVLLMRECSLSPWRSLIYAASPLAVLQFSLDAHIDALGFPFLIWGLLLYQRKKLVLSLLLIGLSLQVKPVALVLLPILFLREQSLANKTKVLVLPLAVLLVPFVPYAITANPFEALITFSEHWLFNGALFSALFPLFNDNQTTRLWCFGILTALLLILYLSKRPLHETMVLAVLLLFLCSPVVHVWYVGWLIVLLPLAPIRSGLALAATASFASITFVSYQLEGIWQDYPLVLVLEYLPVIVLLWFDLRRNKGAPAIC